MPFRLLDTAGRRETSSPLEAEGIARGTRASDEAACRLLVLDGSDLTDAALALSSVTALPRLVVLNKRDLLDDAALDAARTRLPEGHLVISVKTGAGLAELRAALRSQLVGEIDERGPVLFAAAQVRRVEDALAALGSGDVRRAKDLLVSPPPRP